MPTRKRSGRRGTDEPVDHCVRRDEASERALWREYLERFPSGRYADDACWRGYLDDFPQGVHARAASRVLGVDAPDPESQ